MSDAYGLQEEHVIHIEQFLPCAETVSKPAAKANSKNKSPKESMPAQVSNAKSESKTKIGKAAPQPSSKQSEEKAHKSKPTPTSASKKATPADAQKNPKAASKAAKPKASSKKESRPKEQVLKGKAAAANVGDGKAGKKAKEVSKKPAQEADPHKVSLMSDQLPSSVKTQSDILPVDAKCFSIIPWHCSGDPVHLTLT